MHIIQRGNDRQAVFFEDKDYRKYLNILTEYAEKFDCAIHAYVLMTNHIHILATPTEKEGISRLIQAIGRKYVGYINRSYKRSGTLWEGRYKSSLIDSENYFLTCSRYIEMNPVRAGKVESPEQYEWSSYHHNGTGKKNETIKAHNIYMRLGNSETERQNAYKQLFKTVIAQQDVDMIRNNTNQCTIVGNKKFEEAINLMLQRRVGKHEHGGDRKSEGFKNISSGLTP